MRQNCQVKFKILLLFADTSLYSCPQLYKCPSLSTAVASLLAHTPHSLTHTLHTHRHGCVHRNVHATSIRNAKVLQLRSCKFVYANSHIVMCVSGPTCMCVYVYVCVFVWVCKSHCVHGLAMCGCHLTRSTFIFWPLIAWSEPASTAAAQQFVCMCVWGKGNPQQSMPVGLLANKVQH